MRIDLLHAMLHIQTHSAAPHLLHLVLEGALDAMHVVALEEAIRKELPCDSLQLVLHCDGLQAVDDEGVRLLARLKHDGALLEGVPLIVDWKLRHLEHYLQSKE